jgi:hypothetical protein
MATLPPPQPPGSPLADVYEALGITDVDRVSLCWKGNQPGMHTVVGTVAEVVELAATLAGDPTVQHVYFGVNPVTLPTGTLGARGTEDDIARTVALYADLDVKPGGCPDLDTAHAIVEDIAGILNVRPVAVIMSGGGLQPIWALDNCDRATGRALLRRFGRLVRVVAEARHVKVDSVFDLARVLRVPGTLNRKYDPPVEAALIPDTGGPMAPFAVAEYLAEVGIDEMADDTATLGDPVTDADDWQHGGQWCRYARAAVLGWATDAPASGGRHQAMLDNCVRLAAMYRLGCLPDKAALDATLDAIGQRHESLCAAPGPQQRRVPPYEIQAAWAWALDRVTRMSDDRARAELGQHRHDAAPKLLAAPTALLDLEPVTVDLQHDSPLADVEQGFWASRASLKLIYDTALARMVSPWAVLGCCAARALTQVNPHVTLPPLIGGRGSLNWFVAIAAASGGGKGTANAVARQLVPGEITVRNVGSGEGIVHAYRDTGTETGWRESIMFNVDEVDTLTALGNRSGSTMMGILRSAFSGEELGFAYVARGGEHLKPHCYRLTLVVGVQPARAGGLMADAGGGTPQRFMWFPGTDARITDAPMWASTDTLTLPPRSVWQYPREVFIPEDAAAFIRREHARNQRGETDALDGHAVFCREKFAFALAILDGRHAITETDWELSGIAAAVSDMTRAWVRAELARAEDADAAELGRRYGVRAEAAEAEKTYQEQRRHNRITLWALDKLKSAGAEGMLWIELSRMASSRDRHYLAGILAGLQSDGLATVEDAAKGGKRWRIVL